MHLYWQSKIFALLHDPVFKPLGKYKDGESFWKNLKVMEGFSQEGKLISYLKNADYVSAASDRGAIGNLSTYINYAAEGLEISHLLSGAKQHIKVSDCQELITKEQKLFPDFIKQETDARKVFWWLWRCLPTAACQAANFPFTGEPI